MKVGAPGFFGAQRKALREAAGFTQEDLATIAGLSVHAVSALERRERRRTELKDGRTFTLRPGMSYQVADNAEPHRFSTLVGARVFIVD